MEFVKFRDPKEFKDSAWPLLLRHEAENNLMLGIVDRLASQPSAEPPLEEAPILGTVVRGGVTEAAVMMTPPHKLVLTRCTLDVTEFMAERLMSLDVALPGVLGPRDTAESFASAWARLTAGESRLDMRMRIYQLDRVELLVAYAGQMEEASPADLASLLPWSMAFHEAIHEPLEGVEDALKRRMAHHEIVVWKNERQVSMAAFGSPTPNGVRINHVYTPPEHRRKGYATALVAALSRRLLESGRTFCFLFTDLANPTSNSIYQKIGYRPVSDVDAYGFR